MKIILIETENKCITFSKMTETEILETECLTSRQEYCEFDEKCSFQMHEKGCLSVDRMMESETLETECLTSRQKYCESDEKCSFQMHEKECLSVDGILERYVGEFGRAQVWHFLLVSLAWTLEGLTTMATIFADRVPEWNCVPQKFLESNGTQVCTQLCDLDPFRRERAVSNAASTVSEWNLICGDEYKAGLAGSLFFIGGLLGEGIYGSLSDSILGRKGALALACMTTSMMGLLTSVAPNYWMYILLRFLTGMNASGIGLCCFVLGTELVGPTRREAVGMFCFYFFSFGVMILPAFGYLSATSWRTLYFFIGISGVIYCVVVLPVLSESPRWFLVKGRAEEALRVLRAFAEKNGSFLPPTVHLIADNTEPQAEFEDDEPEATQKYDDDSVTLVLGHPARRDETHAPIAIKIHGCEPRRKESAECVGTVFTVFRCEETRCRMLLMVCIWFFIGVAYFGISLNVVNMHFNLYLGVFLNGLIEIPAIALPAIMLNKLGKRFMLIFALCFSSVFCLLGSLLYVDQAEESVMSTDSGSIDSLNGLGNSNITSGRYPEPDQLLSHFGLTSEGSTNVLASLRLLCGVAGLLGIAGAYSLLYIYTLELFPTVVRNAALGLASQFASIGSVIAPLVVVLGRYNPSAPFIVFGIFSMLGAIIGFRLPDYRHEALFETIEGMEEAENAKKRYHSRGLV